MMATIEPAIAHLEFEPDRLQCACDEKACAHHAGHQCTRTATHRVWIHAFGERKDPQFLPDGCARELVCAECIPVRNDKVDGLLQASYRLHFFRSQWLHCTSCHAPITSVQRIYKAVEL